ncbi:MAG: HD domain-containing protein [Christensenellaceae bacterium]|nr:HD domain-containing protein [Christensenellaceae bacterium]
MEQFSVSQLVKDVRFEGFLLVRSSDQRTGSNGSRYLDMNLTDRTGEINCKMWDGNVAPPPVGTVIKVRGLVQEYNGRLQLRVERIRPSTPADQVDLSRLVPCAPEAPEKMMGEIEATIDRFQSEDLKKITREMLRLAGDRLEWFPAAQRLHHAERSGLLHHTTGMLRTAEHIIEAYPFLRGDLLRAGVILHDLSKITEMKSDELGNVTDYTRDGLLIGHLVRGVARLSEAAKNVGVEGELVVLLEHMIISHHGEAEYGSPRMPMFPEAEVLHWIDLLDARMNEMQGIMDRTPAGAFSEKIWSLDRRMYHPLYEGLDEPVQE